MPLQPDSEKLEVDFKPATAVVIAPLLGPDGADDEGKPLYVVAFQCYPFDHPLHEDTGAVIDFEYLTFLVALAHRAAYDTGREDEFITLVQYTLDRLGTDTIPTVTATRIDL